MKKISMVALILLCHTSSADAASPKSANLPITWNGLGIANETIFESYKTSPELVGQGFFDKGAVSLNGSWKALNQMGKCDLKTFEFVAMFVNSESSRQSLRKKIIAQLSTKSTVNLLGDLPPVSVYKIKSAGKTVAITFNDVDLANGSIVLGSHSCVVK